MLNYNPSLEPPTRLEAIDLLQACWPLLDKIKKVVGTAEMKLADYDLPILMGFQKVVLAGLICDLDILARSGLTSADVVEIDHLLACYLKDSISIINRLEKPEYLSNGPG